MANLYGNIEFYSPDGILMFVKNQHALNFYLKNNLVDKIEENKYKLNFIPKGLGYNGKKILRENKCVVSGDSNAELLTKHHIIPSCFRTHFPINKKDSKFQFIVLIRSDIHSKYTSIEQEYYNEIGMMYGLTDSFQTAVKDFQANNRVLKKAITALYYFSDKIPEERAIMLRTEFEEKTGLKPTQKFLKLTLEELTKKERTEWFNYKSSNFSFGKKIVDKIENFEEFENLWLRHFVENAKPKFLPDDLKELIEKRKIF